MLLKNVKDLADNEIDKLIDLYVWGLRSGNYPEMLDVEHKSLKKYGYLRDSEFSYDFTEEGEKAFEEFWKPIEEAFEKEKPSISNYESIVRVSKITGLSTFLIYRIAERREK